MEKSSYKTPDFIHDDDKVSKYTGSKIREKKTIGQAAQPSATRISKGNGY